MSLSIKSMVLAVGIFLFFMTTLLPANSHALDDHSQRVLDALKPLPPVGTVLSEQSKDVGGGFRLVRQAIVLGPAAEGSISEGVGHFIFLFYGDEKLSQTDMYSVSPSGEYALFQDGPTGKVILVKPKNKSVKPVVPEFRGLVSDFAWDEKKNEAVIKFEKSEKTSGEGLIQRVNLQ